MAALTAPQAAGNCLLVSANRFAAPYPVYPIGVAHLLGALRQQGHRADHVDILAMNGLDRLGLLLRDNRYDAVGISIRNIDTVDSATPTAMIEDIVEVIDFVQARSNAPVVLGGPGFSIMPEKLLAHLGADYGVVGEGEIAFPRLLARLAAGETVEERLVYAPLQDYPEHRPHFSPDIARYYVEHGGMLNVQTKRGCGYGCSYCSYPAIEGRKLRFRPAQQVVEEIARLRRDHGARYIFFTDGVFNDPAGHYLEVAEALVRAGNTTPWCAFFRPQHIGHEQLRLLKKSGLAAMELGTDAASDETLAALNKGFTFAEAHAVNQLIAAEGIPCAHFIVFGGPGETMETVRQGLANIARLSDCIVFAYIGLRLLPGTRLFRQALEEKVIDADTDVIRPLFYYSPAIERQSVDAELRRAFVGRRDRIYPLKDMEQYVRLFHSLGHSGPLWDLMLPGRSKRRVS